MFDQKLDGGISRRSFVKAAAAGTVLAAATAGAAAAWADDAGTVPAAADDVEWAEEADVLVVGYGGAGAAAAIEACRAGAKVVVFEMQGIAGGSTIASGGQIMMGGTKLQVKFGIEDDPENYYTYMCAAGGSNAGVDHLKVICDAAPDLYDWCVECGMDFESGVCDTEHHMGGTNKVGISLGYSGNELARDFAAVATPAPRGHMPQPSSAGVDVFTPLSDTVSELGIDVRMETQVKRLVVNLDGRIVGVVAQGPDGQFAVKANKAVVLTAGGFSNNAQMVEENFSLNNKRGTTIVAAGNENGSGILMAQAVGAATFGMGCFQIGVALSTTNEALPHCVLVDGNGRRIVAEDEYNSFIGKALAMAPSSTCFMIFDDRYATESGAAELYGDPLATADSIGELAKAVGLNADVLISTVDFYNESASLGEDREFGKHASYLTPLETGPFHAFAFGSERCYLASCGGVKIDTGAHVVDRDGNSIPGLYAAGRNAGSIYGWYMGSGSSLADVLTFGRIAGKNAAAE